LRFFWKSPQGEGTAATGYKGFYYHFLDMETGRRAHRSEVSTVDSALLFAGALVAAAYFRGDDERERESRTLADAIDRRAHWPRARCSCISARTSGSTSAESRTPTCASAGSITSRTAGARRSASSGTR